MMSALKTLSSRSYPSATLITGVSLMCFSATLPLHIPNCRNRLLRTFVDLNSELLLNEHGGDFKEDPNALFKAIIDAETESISKK